MKRLLIAPATALLLAGCFEEEKVRDVSYYKENESVRNSTLKECRNNVAEAVKDGNCINALAAAKQLEKERQEDIWKSDANLEPPVFE